MTTIEYDDGYKREVQNTSHGVLEMHGRPYLHVTVITHIAIRTVRTSMSAILLKMNNNH